MSIRARATGIFERFRDYVRRVRDSRADLVDGTSSENALPPIPPDTPRSGLRRRG
jgi:hypothetical protein